MLAQSLPLSGVVGEAGTRLGRRDGQDETTMRAWQRLDRHDRVPPGAEAGAASNGLAGRGPWQHGRKTHKSARRFGIPASGESVRAEPGAAPSFDQSLPAPAQVIAPQPVVAVENAQDRFAKRARRRPRLFSGRRPSIFVAGVATVGITAHGRLFFARPLARNSDRARHAHSGKTPSSRSQSSEVVDGPVAR